MKDRETLKEVLRIILQRISAQDRELASRVQGSFAGVMDEVGYRDRRAISFYRRFSIAAVAAAAVIGVFFTVTLVNIGREHNEEAVAAASWTRLTVPEGEHVDMTLSDGTRLYVNSGSEVEIPSVFDPEKREIRMTGEVYLEVAKDAERPFFVETEDFDVRVYGTSFNVSAYPEDGVSSVVLVEGSVAVSAGDMTRFIEPGQKMEISGGRMDVSDVDVMEYVGWKDRIIITGGQTLDQIMQKLARYYGADISVSDEVAGMMMNGKLDLQEDLSSVLDNLCILLPLEYERCKGDRYIISFRK